MREIGLRRLFCLTWSDTRVDFYCVMSTMLSCQCSLFQMPLPTCCNNKNVIPVFQHHTPGVPSSMYEHDRDIGRNKHYLIARCLEVLVRALREGKITLLSKVSCGVIIEARFRVTGAQWRSSAYVYSFPRSSSSSSPPPPSRMHRE